MAVSGLTDLAGRVLADRYRLRVPIGAGASGQVYLADDAILRRRVAVKVLHAGLAGDAGFLRRFRTEARLAASLNHPNVMTVYDWGDDGVPFMVLELLEGGSLRAMLDRGVRLTPAQATQVGRQVCSALEYARGRGFVHRDIKPANLLFDEHGIVRVADFGLARALAEASWTEPAGTMLGTARYASPEQARGVALDVRSDLYSLALVLIESVTGTVPNVTDTTLGTLLARTHESIVAPPELGPLGPVIERAGRVEPDERYPDAATMHAGLGDAAKSLPPPGALVLAGLGGPAVDPHPTQVRREVDRSVGQDPVVVDDGAGVTVSDRDESVGPAARHFRRRASSDATVAAVPVVLDTTGAHGGGAPESGQGVGAGERGEDDRRLALLDRPRRRAFPTAGLLVSVASVLAVAAALAVVWQPASSGVVVPALVGRARTDAAAHLAQAGLTAELVTRQADDPKGIVIEQIPRPGDWAGDGEPVRLVVSSGPPQVVVDEVAGKVAGEARGILELRGFVVRDEQRNDEVVAQGLAIGTEPAGGANAPRDSVIKLLISTGPAPVPVPEVAGEKYDRAVELLGAKKFGAVRVDDYSESVEAGLVISTEPAAGVAHPRDADVTVHVSKGPEYVEVPDVRGQDLEKASARLRELGLTVEVSNFFPGKRVVAQAPSGGEQRKKGDTVRLFL